MLTKSQEKLIKSLQTKKGRKESGFCLVEGKKLVSELKKPQVEFTFTEKDTRNFKKLVTTKTPQEIAAVAKTPSWKLKDIEKQDRIVVLDTVQDPGNVGSILRLCLGFNAGLILVNSVDVTSPKVIRSSAGAIFKAPWLNLNTEESKEFLNTTKRKIYRLEKRKGAKEYKKTALSNAVIIAGSEGQGIIHNFSGQSIYIDHNSKLESLNVGHALAIILSE